MAGAPWTPTNERHVYYHDTSPMRISRNTVRHPDRYATLLPPLQEHHKSGSSDEEEMEARPRDSATEISSSSSLFSGTTLYTDASEDDCRPEPPPLVHTLFEELSQTWQFVVADPVSRHAVIVDPQLDNAPAATMISTIAADRALAVIRQNRYIVDRILQTHEPKDHPSSAWYLRAQLLQSTGHAPKITVGKTMAAVQRRFERKYSIKTNDGSIWKTDYEDSKFPDGESFAIGTIRATALHFPGGTSAFVIGQHIFAGASRSDLELRARKDLLIHDLRSFRIYTSRDAPPQRRAHLTPVNEHERRIGKPDHGKKLVIRHGADDGTLDFGILK